MPTSSRPLRCLIASRPRCAREQTEDAMKKPLIAVLSLGLSVGASLSPAMAAGPRASGGNDWPGMSAPAYPIASPGYRPDAAAKCGVYDTYCYYQGRLSLDNSGRNR